MHQARLPSRRCRWSASLGTASPASKPVDHTPGLSASRMKWVEQGRWHTHRLVQRCCAALVEGRRPAHPGMHRGRMRGGGTAAARRRPASTAVHRCRAVRGRGAAELVARRAVGEIGVGRRRSPHPARVSALDAEPPLIVLDADGHSLVGRLHLHLHVRLRRVRDHPDHALVRAADNNDIVRLNAFGQVGAAATPSAAPAPAPSSPTTSVAAAPSVRLAVADCAEHANVLRRYLRRHRGTGQARVSELVWCVGSRIQQGRVSLLQSKDGKSVFASLFIRLLGRFFFISGPFYPATREATLCWGGLAHLDVER